MKSVSKDWKNRGDSLDLFVDEARTPALVSTFLLMELIRRIWNMVVVGTRHGGRRAKCMVEE